MIFSVPLFHNVQLSVHAGLFVFIVLFNTVYHYTIELMVYLQHMVDHLISLLGYYQVQGPVCTILHVRIFIIFVNSGVLEIMVFPYTSFSSLTHDHLYMCLTIGYFLTYCLLLYF